jgi:hypothetical protein
LRLLNRWRTLVGRVTILFLPVMGGNKSGWVHNVKNDG